MRIFSISDKFVFSLIIMILFVSSICIFSVSALPQQQISFGVKITNPAKGQRVSIGKNLTLSGTSNYNATSNCGVFVIVDGIRPYQKAVPIGQPGGNDYSKWKYTFTPAYPGTIREGINRITAKLVCPANPANLTKFYSINVTGMNRIVPNKYSAITGNNTTNSSNSSSLINHLSILANSASSGGGHRHHSINGKGHANTVESSNHHGGYPYVNCRIFILSHGPCL
jgi:hypothetical protein